MAEVEAKDPAERKFELPAEAKSLTEEQQEVVRALWTSKRERAMGARRRPKYRIFRSVVDKL